MATQQQLCPRESSLALFLVSLNHSITRSASPVWSTRYSDDATEDDDHNNNNDDDDNDEKATANTTTGQPIRARS